MSEQSSSPAPRKRGKLILHGGNTLPGCPQASPVDNGRGAPCAHIGPHIGIDEAGRGCLAGPVVAAAVLFPENFPFQEALPGLGDSKQLSETLRSSLASGITAKALAFGVGLAWQDEIDAINILNATFRAMSRAVLALAARLQAHELSTPQLPQLLIDGNKTIPEGHWLSCTGGATASALSWEQYFPLPLSARPSMALPLPPQKAVVGGDALVPAISAASVLAKTVRDGMMQRLDEFFPGYGLAGHKGYGTREHLEALKRLGPSALHRLTFQGVRPSDEAGPKVVQPLLF